MRYVEALSICLPEDKGKERNCSAEHLMEEINSIPNLKEAMKRVRRNEGAAGVDGMKISETMEWLTAHFAGAQAQLMGGYYHPTAVRRREIPKLDGKLDGGVRKLGIPTVKDRVVQQAIKKVKEYAEEAAICMISTIIDIPPFAFLWIRFLGK